MPLPGAGSAPAEAGVVRLRTMVGVPIVEVVDDRLGDHNVDALRAALESALGEAAGRVVVDMAAVAYLSSVAIGALVGCRGTGEERGIEVRFAALQPWVLEILDTTGVASVLPSYADVLPAVTA